MSKLLYKIYKANPSEILGEIIRTKVLMDCLYFFFTVFDRPKGQNINKDIETTFSKLYKIYFLCSHFMKLMCYKATAISH